MTWSSWLWNWWSCQLWILGRLYGFKVITRTFLHFASNSVCIWFKQSRSFWKVWPDNTQNTSLILVKLLLSWSVSLFGLVQSLSYQAQSQSLRLRPGYSHTVWDSESLRLILWWLSSSVLKWYCDTCFFGHEMPCASMYYNATLAQPWPRGVNTLRKHMRQV